jgi:hypothetical protein
MHLPGLRPGTWYRVVAAPADAAAHMRDDLWLEVDGRVRRFGRPTRPRPEKATLDEALALLGIWRMSSARNESSRLWDEIRAAFEPHRVGADRDAVAALNRISVKCLGLDRPIPLEPSNTIVSEELLAPGEFRNLVLYHRRSKPLRSHEPIVIVTWAGKRFVLDGNTRVNMWLQGDQLVPRRAIVLQPRSRGTTPSQAVDSLDGSSAAS